MITDIARSLRRRRVPSGSLAILWLGQAGFVFKTAAGRTLCIDPYLTDSVERLAGFKRIMASVMTPAQMRPDVMLITHHHEDHLDVDALPVVARRTRARFIAPEESAKKLVAIGIPPGRIQTARRGSPVPLGFVTVHPVFADHGELAPDALGYVLDFDGIRVYVTGDTAYRPDKMTEAMSLRPHVIIPVINGAYGNLGAREAAVLTRDVGAAAVIPCHFWTFIEHGGDPAAFVKTCAAEAPSARVVLMTQGGTYLHSS